MVDKKATIEKTIEETKFIELPIIDVDEESVFVKIQDWRMRVYFEDKTINPLEYNGKLIKVEYVGDITEIFSLKLVPLKKLETIQ